MTQFAFVTLEVRIDGHLAEIVLNEPASHNAVTHAMHFELKDAERRNAMRAQVRPLLLSIADSHIPVI